MPKHNKDIASLTAIKCWSRNKGKMQILTNTYPVKNSCI